MLFSPTLVQELARLPGAQHSFLKQLCGGEHAHLRQGLDRALAALPDAVQQRCARKLSSLDNRRFFQGFADLSTAITLMRAGWTVTGDAPGDLLAARRPDGSAVDVLVVAFLHAGSDELDQPGIRRLRDALDRVHTRLRFCVYVRRWLPVDFDPESVRQAVELWLREVEGGRWASRFAAYEDKHVHLEFGLVGDRESPRRVVGDERPVLVTLGPFVAERSMGAIEARVVRDLDRHRVGSAGSQNPVFLSLVSDQPWRLSDGYVREFLYGKPRWVQTSWAQDEPSWEACLSRAAEPCLFKDPLYSGVIGCSMLHRESMETLTVRGKAFSNPFATAPLTGDDVGLPVLARYSSDDGRPVLRWFGESAGRVRLDKPTRDD